MHKRLIIWAVLMIALLVGCGDDYMTRHENRRLRVVDAYDDCCILVDTETGIGYLMTDSYMDGGITVMYDKDGNIYRPNGWRDYGN